MFNSSLNSRVFFCLHLSLLQWNWKLQMNDRDGMNWVKIAICAPLPMQTIDFYANHSHTRNTNIFKILVWFGWTFFLFFRWNWSAYASIAKWQTIDLQQHIHDIFFPSLTPPVVFVYHTTFFWHFLFVETISFIVLWKFATEKKYKNIKFACHSAYIQWIVFLDRPVSLRYYYCCSTLSNLVLCVCFYYFFSSSLFHSDPHNFIEKLWNFFFSFCIFLHLI